MKNNTLPERHRILQRSSNITLGGRRQGVKGYDGIRFIAVGQQPEQNATQEAHKTPYEQCQDYLMKQEDTQQVVMVQQPHMKLGATIDTVSNSKAPDIQKLIPDPSTESASRPKIGLTKRYYNRLSDYSQVQDRIKLMETKMQSIRQTFTTKPAGDCTYIRDMKHIDARAHGRIETQPTEMHDNSQEMASMESMILASDDQSNAVQDSPKYSLKEDIVASFVTQQPQPARLIHCSSQNNLRSPRNNLLTSLYSNKYYVGTLMTAFTDQANTSFMQLCRAHLKNSIVQLKGAKNVMKPQDHELPNIRKLPASTKKHTIVFDLDETLVHCNEKPDLPSDIVLRLNIAGKSKPARVGVNIRPYAVECLRELSQIYELILFTASHEVYANAVADYLDPKKQLFSHRYFRESCYKTPDGYIKDLRLIDRPAKNMLLIDNAAYSYAFHIENGVPIIPFYDCRTDCELKHLSSYLKSLHGADNLPQQHCRTLQCHLYQQYERPEDLLRSLYHTRLV